jgi:biopolymer transport protein TolR
MMLGGNDDRLMSEINVTPFVDVMLVLLIIFMVTAPMMMQGVDVSLPEVGSAPLTSEQEQMTVTIDKNSQVYINDYRVGIENLKEKLIQINKNKKADELYLRADKSVAYGTVVYVMSEIKGAGIDKLGMITDPVDESENDRKK